MFHCAEGHRAGPGRKMSRVPTTVRVVRHEHVLKDPVNGHERYVHTSVSTEIVEEKPFCPDHAGEAKNRPPMILGSDKNPDAVRYHVVVKRLGYIRSYRPQK